jgi:hypothetical protein
MEEFKTELCEILFKYKSDKCPQIFHSYSPSYFEELHKIKNDVKYVLEIGVGTNEIMKPICGEKYQIGASLKAWRDFFRNAKIFGVDINKEILFQEDRIKCFYTNQSNSNSLEETITQIKKNELNSDLKFDIVIDDGSHIVEHMIISYKTISKYVVNGGLYIIEDIKKKDLDIFTSLNIKDFEILKIHEGNFEWDSFVIYKKKHEL